MLKLQFGKRIENFLTTITLELIFKHLSSKPTFYYKKAIVKCKWGLKISLESETTLKSLNCEQLSILETSTIISGWRESDDLDLLNIKLLNLFGFNFISQRLHHEKIFKLSSVKFATISIQSLRK